MATAPLNDSKSNVLTMTPHLVRKPMQVVPTKMGLMGDQGVGKTTTAALYLAAVSKLYHAGAPIIVTDPELGWQFLDPVIFQTEGIRLIQRTVPTFAAMMKDIDFAEKEGACAYGVELGKIWIEILHSLQKSKPDTWGMELRVLWDAFVARFLNSPLHCLVLGRIQDVLEQVMTESGKIQSVKVGEGMKAGGQSNNFGYEPHLVIRMYREQKPRVKKGKTFEDEGRVIHRALVTKDRSWALNGRVFRWPDRDGYRPGDFKYVWESLAPHFAAVQKTMSRPTLDTTQSSEEILLPDGRSEYTARRERKDAISAEITSCLDLSFGGRAKDDIQVRLAVCELIFGVKSREARDRMTLDQLERGLRILHIYERYPEHHLDSQEDILVQLSAAIAEYDSGYAEMPDLPF